VKPRAYEGKEPYIFISYAHKDSELVFRVMDSLQDEGYRIWYDDGIMPGSEWPENIAQHLDAASMVIAMITPNSMDSHNCRREINFALSRRKPFLALILEPTKMSLGMEMQLSAQHNIYLQNYSKWDDFIDKILVCEDLQPCKILQPAEVPVIEQKAQSPAEAVSVKEEPKVEIEVKLEPVQKEPVPKPKIKREKPVLNRKKEKAVPEETETKPKNKKQIGKWLLSALVGLVLIVAIGLGIRTATTSETSWGDVVEKSATSVNVYQETVTQKDLELLFSLSKLRSLSFTNCDFTGCDFNGLQFTSSELDSLDIINCTGINDYGFLQGPVFTYLELEGCKNFTDLSLIDQSGLQKLNISGTGVSDLSALAAPKLHYIYFNETAISDISPLAMSPNLWTVSGGNSGVTNIDALASLEKLEELYFDGCSISQVSVPFNSLRLYELSFANCGLTDLSGFANVTQLSKLDVRGNPELTDLSWLDMQNCDTLKYLYADKTGLEASDIAFVADCGLVKELYISGISGVDLSICAKLPELKILYAEGCGITDVSGLKNCSKLETIMLGFNEIQDVSPLSGRETDIQCLDLAFNQISNVSSLKNKIQTLFLVGNDENLAKTISGELRCHNIAVDWCEGIIDGGLSNKGEFSAIYLIGCPQNRIVETEEVLGRGYCYYVDTQQLFELAAEDELSYRTWTDFRYTSELYQNRT